MLANIVLEKFTEGGWVMWPILAAFMLALCVILDRAVWWSVLRTKIRPNLQNNAREALGTGDFTTAWNLGANTPEPFLENMREGMSHANTSMLAAMQLHATQLIEKSEARMWILSTMITLAPLLGLFGTVAGLMGSFAAIGTDQLAVTKVTGGIGEALIATASGIAIAVICLLPYNFFRKRVALLRSALERWINHSELLVKSAREHGHNLETFALQIQQAAASAEAPQD
ncbi:MAG: MotA/TolQ/ExbB proton channel family protein [Verrucomicrobiales bacterium]|nr:MotA/TolQ/ExbB proton channel family protein [Verrucomicrobiota bacterium JB025]